VFNYDSVNGIQSVNTVQTTAPDGVPSGTPRMGRKKEGK